MSRRVAVRDVRGAGGRVKDWRVTGPKAITRGIAETLAACGRWTGRAVLLAVLTAGVVVWAASLGPLTLPDRAAAGIAARLSDRLAVHGLTARIEAAEVTLRAGAVPVVSVEGLHVAGRDGAKVATVGRAEAVLSRRALLTGRASPTALRAAGLELSLLRDADGRVRQAAGREAVPVVDAADPAALLAGFRTMLDRPLFDRLEVVGVEDVALSLDDAVRARRARTEDGTLRLDIGPGGALALSVDPGRFMPGDGAGRVRARLEVAADGTARADLRLRGLVPAETAGIAGVGPLADLLSRIAAPVSADLSGRLDAHGSLADLSGEIAVGAGRVRLPGLAAPVALRSLGAAVTLGPRGNLVRLTDLALDTDRVRLAGAVTLRADPGGAVGPIAAQAVLRDVRLDLPGVHAAPVTFDGLWAEARYGRDGAGVSVPAFTVTRGETRVTGSASVRRGADGAEPRVALDVATDEIAPATLVALWPEGRIEGTRDWLRDHVNEGRFTDVTAALRLGDGRPPEVGLSFAFAGAVVRPVPGLPPITGGRGVGGIDGHVLTVAVTDGQMKAVEGAPLRLARGVVRLPDIRERNGTLELAFAAGTDTTGALSLLSEPAFRKGDAAEVLVTPGEADGDVSVSAEMAIPLYRRTRMADVAFAIEGAVSKFATDALLPGRTLRADRLTIRADPETVRLSGPAEVSGVPMEVSYARVIAPGNPDAGTAEIAASGRLDAATVSAAGIALPGARLTGAGSWRARVDLAPGAPPVFEASADLAGLGVAVPALGLRKARGAAGSVAAAGRLGPGGRIDPVTVRFPGLALDAGLTLGPDGPGAVALSRLRVGDWLDAKGRFDPVAGRLSLTAGRLDLRALPTGMRGAGGRGTLRRIDLALDRVDLTDAVALSDFTGRLDGRMSGEIAARVNGAAPVAVRLVRQDGGMALHATADDAGAVLRAAGFYGNLHGGALDLRLVPAGADLWRGQARVTDTTLRDGPVIARILSGLSVVGALEQAQGAGIRFEDARADFRLTRGGLAIDAASAAGPAIGLSLDGAVDMARRRLDLQGVVSPVYFLNRAGSVLTRRGEGLIGMSYTVTGPMAAPRVAVNPLSVLTPGFMREVFRTDRARLPEPPE